MATTLPIKKRKKLAYTFILSVWAVIQYSLGNKEYSLFIILVFFILTVFRPPSFMLIAGSVLIIVLFNTPAMETLAYLKQTNLRTVEQVRLTLDNIVRPDSGQEVLPVLVQEMLTLLRNNHITSYQLSTANRVYSTLIKQRIIEAAWPIKMDNNSPFFLMLPKETINYPDCSVIDQEKETALVYCY
jgi:hypothetical protein